MTTKYVPNNRVEEHRAQGWTETGNTQPGVLGRTLVEMTTETPLAWLEKENADKQERINRITRTGRRIHYANAALRRRGMDI